MGNLVTQPPLNDECQHPNDEGKPKRTYRLHREAGGWLSFARSFATIVT